MKMVALFWCIFCLWHPHCTSLYSVTVLIVGWEKLLNFSGGWDVQGSANQARYVRLHRVHSHTEARSEGQGRPVIIVWHTWPSVRCALFVPQFLQISSVSWDQLSLCSLFFTLKLNTAKVTYVHTEMFYVEHKTLCVQRRTMLMYLYCIYIKILQIKCIIN